MSQPGSRWYSVDQCFNYNLKREPPKQNHPFRFWSSEPKNLWDQITLSQYFYLSLIEMIELLRIRSSNAIISNIINICMASLGIPNELIKKNWGYNYWDKNCIYIYMHIYNFSVLLVFVIQSNFSLHLINIEYST